jgi:hypothetical protein
MGTQAIIVLPGTAASRTADGQQAAFAAAGYMPEAIVWKAASLWTTNLPLHPKPAGTGWMCLAKCGNITHNDTDFAEHEDCHTICASVPVDLPKSTLCPFKVMTLLQIAT